MKLCLQLGGLCLQEVKSIKSSTVIDSMTFMRAPSSLPCTYKKTVSPSIGIAIVNNIMPCTMLFQKCLAQKNPASTFQPHWIYEQTVTNILTEKDAELKLGFWSIRPFLPYFTSLLHPYYLFGQQ